MNLKGKRKVFTATSHFGFSLVELIVLVAIIGVLVAIAVPRVMRYLAKAKQVEAQTLLGNFYTAEMNYYIDNAMYSTSPIVLGIPLKKNFVFNHGIASTGLTNTKNYCDANPSVCSSLPSASLALRSTCTVRLSGPGIYIGFTACSSATFYQGLDEWSINEAKQLQHLSIGN